MSDLKIEYISTDKLIPYINNPRVNDNAVDKVAASIKEFGFKNPIIIDKENVIVAGHTREKAARKLGLKEVPTIRAEDLSDTQIKAFRLADNKTSEFSEWDVELLDIELDNININMGDFGFKIDDDGLEDIEVEIQEREITPFVKVHYMITADLNKNDVILEYLDELKRVGGIEIESSLN